MSATLVGLFDQAVLAETTAFTDDPTDSDVPFDAPQAAMIAGMIEMKVRTSRYALSRPFARATVFEVTILRGLLSMMYLPGGLPTRCVMSIDHGRKRLTTREIVQRVTLDASSVYHTESG